MQKLMNMTKSLHERNVNYYIKAFEQLERTKSNTFNNAAAYFGCAWMLYRKMYIQAIIAFVCQLALTSSLRILGEHVTFFGDAILGSRIGVIVGFIICIRLFGTYANKIYYNVIKTRLAKNYHTLNNYQSTTLPLAMCFALGHTTSLALSLVLLLTLYFNYCDNSLKPNQNNQKGDAVPSVEKLKQYLDETTTTAQSKKTPAYLAYATLAALCVIISTNLLFGKISALTAGLSTLLPVLV